MHGAQSTVSALVAAAAAVVALAGAVADAQNLKLPPLPEQFTAVVEANIVNKKYTIHMHEWYDHPGDRGRADMYSTREHGFTSSITDFAAGHYYHTNNTGCFYGDPEHLGRFNFFSRDGQPHVTSTAKFFRFGGELTEKYMGVESIRGISCDHWLAQTTSSGQGNTSYSLDYYFSRPDWSLPEVDGQQVPVRLILNGSRLNAFNRTTMQPIIPPSMTSFYHVYDYVSFHVGPPEDSAFEQPCGAVCTSNNATWKADVLPARPCPAVCTAATTAASTPSPQRAKSCDAKDSQLALGIGLFAGGTLLGAVVVFVVMKFMCGAKTGNYETQNNH